MKNKELAQRIKSLRNRKGFSQEELSEKSGLSLRTIQRIENGETEPRGDSLKRLAFAFDVSSDEIIDAGIISSQLIMILVVFAVMYLYNLVIIIINSVRINNDKNVGYFPKIRFIRK